MTPGWLIRPALCRPSPSSPSRPRGMLDERKTRERELWMAQPLTGGASKRRRGHVDWKRVAGTRDGVQVLDLQNTSLRVRVQGDAPHAVVFFCDPPNLVEHFDDVFAQFDDSIGVVCVEQPGFGFSFPKEGYDFTIRAHASATIAALEELPFKTYTLAAPCVATYGAMRAARERPELVTQLVLMQAPDLETEQAWIDRTAEKFVRLVTGIPQIGHHIARTPYVAQWIASRTEPVFGERTYPSVIWKASEKRLLLESLIDISREMFALGVANCMPSLNQVYIRGREEDFAGTKQPTLILWGDSDLSHADSPRDGLLRYVPHADLVLIPDTGHHLEIENPVGVCDPIKRFVATESESR